MVITKRVCQIDSRLTIGHLTKEYQVKDELLLEYYHLVKVMLESLIDVKLKHIPMRRIT